MQQFGHLGQLLGGALQGRLPHLVEQRVDVRHRAGHLVRHDIGRIGGVAQQVGLLRTQADEVVDELLVVVLVAVVAAVQVGLVELLAQRPLRRIGEEGDEARLVEREDPLAAAAQLVGLLARGVAHAGGQSVEVGLVNGVPFVETLSFGLDAAIAIDTTDRRAADTSQEGEALFITSGLKVLSQAKDGFPCTAYLDDDAPVELSPHIFAFQVGPSYGGGFLICPKADPTDGQLDVCYNVRKPALPRLMALFGLARLGRHVGSSVIRTRRVHHAILEFEAEPPCQVDGEQLVGRRFEIQVVPDALSVIFPR